MDYSEGRYSADQLAWILGILTQEGDDIEQDLADIIEKKRLINKGDLLESIHSDVKLGGLNPHLMIEFLSYGRFIEIDFFKSKNTLKAMRQRTNDVVWGIKANGSKRKLKDTRWYAKTVYGKLNRIIGRLQWEYGEEAMSTIKATLMENPDYLSKNFEAKGFQWAFANM